MSATEWHARATVEFHRRVALIRHDQWHAPTPCTDWDLRTLVNHLVNEQLWTPHLLARETIDQVGDRYDGDLLGDEPVAAWAEASRLARAAVDAPGALDGDVHVSWGMIPAREYVLQLTTDLAVHAWDLARGIGVDDTLDADLARYLLAETEPRIVDLTASGAFGTPVDVAADADAQTRLLALLGRRR